MSPSRRNLTIPAALVLTALCALPQGSREHDFWQDIKRATDEDEFFTKMKEALVPEVVPYWQGSYISGTFGERSTIVLGMTDYTLPPSDYEIAVSYPWVANVESGKNRVRIRLEEGQLRKVKYTARYLRYIPGKMTTS